MKKIIYIFLALSMLLIPTYGATQQKGEKQRNRTEQRKFDKEAFIAKRNAFIVEKAKLTKEEAEKFLPLFEELKEKKFRVGMNCRQKIRSLHKKEKTTEKEYLEILYCQIDSRKEEAELDREYIEKFKKILSAEKIFLCQEAEMHFAREFMREGKK